MRPPSHAGKGETPDTHYASTSRQPLFTPLYYEQSFSGNFNPDRFSRMFSVEPKPVLLLMALCWGNTFVLKPFHETTLTLTKRRIYWKHSESLRYLNVGWNNCNQGLEGTRTLSPLVSSPPFCTGTSFTFTNCLSKERSMATSQPPLGSPFFLLQTEL